MKLAERTFKRSDYKVTSPYGWRVHPTTKKQSFHYGEDYGTHLEHWDIFALEQGKVIASNQDATNGHYIWVEYPRLKLKIFYCHLAYRNVFKGESVNENTVIAKVGKSGRASGIHLHMGVKLNGKYFDHSQYDYRELVKVASDLKLIDQVTLSKGDIVKVIGTHWATGSKIPLWVKLKKYEIVKLNEKSALLKGVNSWANLNDLKKVD
jgi:murein DD-endopeptidase MepM/ murein hydrolase activator NlpD